MFAPDRVALQDVLDARGLRGLGQLQQMVRKLQFMVEDPDHDHEELRKLVAQLRRWAGQ